MSLWDKKRYSFFLWPGSVLFGLAIGLRNVLYDRGILSSRRLDAKVISIGNITVGGTGKTPFVQLVTRLLSQKGIPAAVLSRGYGGTAKGFLVVSDGKYIQAGAHLAGDEPVLLAKRLPGVPVLVSPDRIATGTAAIHRFGSRVLVMDDAFQHRKIQRDIDIVLLSSERPFGNGWLLPAGPLREPLSSLKRADAVVLTGFGEPPSETDRAIVSRWTKAPVLYARRKPTVWIRHGTDETLGLNRLKGQSVLAFAGIGNPLSFKKTVLETGTCVSKCVSFPDHYWYQTGDLNRLSSLAEKLGVQAVVTTEKDGVRIGSWNNRTPLYSLRIQMELSGGPEALLRILERLFGCRTP